MIQDDLGNYSIQMGGLKSAYWNLDELLMLFEQLVRLFETKLN